jgi:hypothetical protein
MRSPRVAAWVAATLMAFAIILANSRGDVDRMTEGDGLIYRYVAAHFNADPDDVDPVVVDRGTSLRYGRVGFPALIWLASAGRPAAMPYVQPILIALAAGAAGAAVSVLLPRAGPLAAALPFLAPGFSLAVAGGFAEVVAVAFALWAVVFAQRERWGMAATMLSVALLTRENAGAVLVGLAVWLATRRRIKPIGLLVLAGIPVLAWYSYVAARYGHVPLLDPYLRVTTDTIGPPLIAIWDAITDSTASSTITAVVHLALAVAAFAMWRRSQIATIAAACGLQVLAAGRFSFAYEGEAVRQFIFLQLFLLLALMWSRWRAEPAHPPG